MMKPSSNVVLEPMRNPLTAGALSVVPGLGQLYNGQVRKGILFLEVALLNVLIIAFIASSAGLLDSLQEFAANQHLRPNSDMVGVLKELQRGSPATMMFIAMVLAFVALAVRDAYDTAAWRQRKAIYSDFVLEWSEATSGSYLFHVALIAAFLVLALFFVKPLQRPTQLVEIEFVNTVAPTERRVESRKISTQNAEAHGKKRAENDAPKQSQRLRPVEPLQPARAAQPTRHPARPTRQPEIKPAPAPPPMTPRPLAPAPRVPMQATPPSAPALNALRAPVAGVVPPAPVAGATAPQARVPMPPTLPAPSTLVGLTPTRLAMSPSSGTPLPLAPRASAPIGLGGVPAKSIGSLSSQPAPAPGLSSAASNRPGLVGGAPSPVAVAVGNDEPRAQGTGGPTVVETGSHHFKKLGGGGSSSAPAPSRSSGFRQSFDGMSVRPSTGGSRSDGGRGLSPTRDIDSRESTDGGRQADFSGYMADLQRRIRKHWFPPHGPSTRRVVVQFTVARNGDLSNLRLFKESGDRLADDAALAAVRNAAPLKHLPEHAPESVDIEFTFDYNVFQRGGF